ncbi:MAG: (d)CMP kinase [Bacteroidota bacterium]
MAQKITIAIDGWSSCGKSTLAKDLAKALNYVYVDSGAMYRGVTLFAMRSGWIKDEKIDEAQLRSALETIEISFNLTESGQPELLLNGENVEREIRSLEVSQQVSKVAAIKEVRSFLVDQQRRMGQSGGVVMDGRDIGSVVFPDAELKLFITAAPEVRAGRRYDELKEKGQEVSKQAIIDNLKERDHLDANRNESPLIQTEDAVVIDNTNLNRQEQLEKAKELAKKRISE